MARTISKEELAFLEAIDIETFILSMSILSEELESKANKELTKFMYEFEEIKRELEKFNELKTRFKKTSANCREILASAEAGEIPKSVKDSLIIREFIRLLEAYVQIV